VSVKTLHHISDPRTDKPIGGDRPHPFSMSSKDVELYLTTGSWPTMARNKEKILT
jgi:hypothetical protein